MGRSDALDGWSDSLDLGQSLPGRASTPEVREIRDPSVETDVRVGRERRLRHSGEDRRTEERNPIFKAGGTFQMIHL